VPLALRKSEHVFEGERLALHRCVYRELDSAGPIPRVQDSISHRLSVPKIRFCNNSDEAR
jgi:hypothetical protein